MTERRTERISPSFTQAELARIERASRAVDKSPSEWMRDLALAATRVGAPTATPPAESQTGENVGGVDVIDTKPDTFREG